MRAPPDSPLFPYTTLFRSRVVFGEQIEIAIAALGVPRERVAAVLGVHCGAPTVVVDVEDRKSTRLNSSHVEISYAVFCLKKKNSVRFRGLGASARPAGRGR